MVLRPGSKPITALVPLLLAGLLRVSFLLDLRTAAAVLLEGGIVAWALWQRPPFLMAELRLLRYAFFSWRDHPEIPTGARAIPLPADSWIVQMLGMIAAMSVLEAAGLHMVLVRSHPRVAWLLTAVSLYGTIVLVALARSIVLRPTLVTADELILRYGLLRQMRIARDNIVAIRPARPADQPDARFTFGLDPKFVIELREPVTVESLYGLRRRNARTVAISAMLDI